MTNVCTEEEWGKDRSGGWEIWERNIMGLTDSTYHAFQVVTWAEIVALGDRWSLNNPFVLEKVVFNLLGKISYDCQSPWVYKERRNVLITVDFFLMWMMGNLLSLQKYFLGSV